MSALASQLQQLENSSPQQRTDGYQQLLQSIIASDDDLASNLVAYIQSITSDSIGVIHSRPLLSAFTESFRSLSNNDAKIEAADQIVQLLAPKAISYEQQDTELKLILADAYEAGEDFTSSAKTLETITLSSSQRSVSDDEKAKVWMRICRCYLEDNETVKASSYLNKIKNVYHTITDQATKLQFQLSQARISDSQRNFLDASSSYLQLSNESVIDEDERLQALSAAITCAVLAPAGPQRARQLGKLYKDDRATETPEYSILEKIFLDRLLTPNEVSNFASGLKEHQLARTSDGSTVLDKAVLEHNLLAVSRIYANISFDNLGTLLGVNGERAESYASAMIESQRLSGVIDQISGMIHFRGNVREGPTNKGTVNLRAWDSNIQNLAEEVERVATMLQRQEAAWYEQRVTG